MKQEDHRQFANATRKKHGTRNRKSSEQPGAQEPTSDRLVNLGDTKLRKHRRRSDPMRDFDALPPPLRRWLSQAVLPWSPSSCRRIWHRAQQRGETTEMTLERLSRSEARMLERDRPFP